MHRIKKGKRDPAFDTLSTSATSQQIQTCDGGLCRPWEWNFDDEINPQGWMAAFSDEERDFLFEFQEKKKSHRMPCFRDDSHFEEPAEIIILCRNLLEHAHEHGDLAMKHLGVFLDLEDIERMKAVPDDQSDVDWHHIIFKNAIVNLFASRFPELVHTLIYCTDDNVLTAQAVKTL